MIICSHICGSKWASVIEATCNAKLATGDGSVFNSTAFNSGALVDAVWFDAFVSLVTVDDDSVAVDSVTVDVVVLAVASLEASVGAGAESATTGVETSLGTSTTTG